MKINVEVDCTPVEARALMGLPDLTPLHDEYVDMIRTTLKNGVSPELIDGVVKSWSSTGEAGVQFWRRLFEGGKTG